MKKDEYLKKERKHRIAIANESFIIVAYTATGEIRFLQDSLWRKNAGQIWTKFKSYAKTYDNFKDAQLEARKLNYKYRSMKPSPTKGILINVTDDDY